MVNETQNSVDSRLYGIIGPLEPKRPEMSLLRFPYNGRVVEAALHQFVGDTPSEAREKMGGFSNPEAGDEYLCFEPATSPEAIAVYAHKMKYFDDGLPFRLAGDVPFQVGETLRTEDGVFLNVPYIDNRDRTTWRCKNDLRFLLGDNPLEINGVLFQNYSGKFGPRDLSFIPHNSFKTGRQSIDDFCRGGLARGLEFSMEDTANQMKSALEKSDSVQDVYVGDLKGLLGDFPENGEPPVFIHKNTLVIGGDGWISPEEIRVTGIIKQRYTQTRNMQEEMREIRKE